MELENDWGWKTYNKRKSSKDPNDFFLAISIIAWLSKLKKKSQTENHDNKPSDLLMSEIDVVNLNMSQNYKQ